MSKEVDRSCYPHTCSHCNSPAFLGLNKAQCSNPKCENYEHRVSTSHISRHTDVTLQKSNCARIKRMLIGYETMASIFAKPVPGHIYEVFPQLPKDACAITILRSDSSAGYWIYFESSEFEPIENCAPIPTIELRVEVKE